jgi:hypothetical protein
MRLTVAADTPTLAAICLPVWRCRRNASITEYVAGAVWLGKEWGREERSRNPSTPSARKRLTHLATVLAVVLKWRAAAALFRPVPVVNQIRIYWWCSPPRTGRQRMCPVRSTARETGVSFSKDRCVRTSL